MQNVNPKQISKIYNDENCKMLAEEVADSLELDVLLDMAYNHILSNIEGCEEDFIKAYKLHYGE